MDHIYLTLLLKLLQLAGRERIARGIIVHIFMLILSFELDLPGTLELTVLMLVVVFESPGRDPAREAQLDIALETTGSYCHGQPFFQHFSDTTKGFVGFEDIRLTGHSVSCPLWSATPQPYPLDQRGSGHRRAGPLHADNVRGLSHAEIAVGQVC
ncbi:uncharacterized protein LOC108023313 isoform X1 [Drosophila biarmipes]|uniref:uncharacterized protein LOC108023313 isoform X1 n=1 Tax=Drosophila biarmipes TaxID=125945 RepID=UPI0007E64233|nr:uncharacterized protein LOC108023313 isoform X1 [Drosophila biarmipes]